MQFVTHGPDIPNDLLQAHEDGRVVFFCGAGISYQAGLPGFKGLVDEIYRIVGTTQNPIEKQAYLREQYDATLDLLERRLPGQRLDVRKALAQTLKPNLRRKGATDTHRALLQLARSREGAFRLVTTNFDRIFHRLTVRIKPTVAVYPAPLLPIPKNSRWNGLVYLHGLLPESLDESALNRLVLTSGDFGLAYLTERWAARFVSELFRNYIVCFVGYSINDPVMRYMMDALAADGMLGEISPKAYAFGDCQPGLETEKMVEWEAKGVTPILYEKPSGTHDHSALYGTLKAWANTYRDGVQGKERIVVDYALTKPSASTKQDDYVGRMLWALSHKSGLPAKRFANFNPVPSLEWLEPFSENCFLHSDLSRFGVSPHQKPDEKLKFSLICRPAPYSHTPWMMLTQSGLKNSNFDYVMEHLARWLTRHLNDPELVLWLSQHGTQLNDRLVWMIDSELERFSKLENDGNIAELDRIRADAPNAIPQPLMRTLWRLLIAGLVKPPWRDVDLYSWQTRFSRDGMTAILRIELRALLAPKIALKKPFHWHDEKIEKTEPTRIAHLVDCELVLTADHIRSSLNDLQKSEAWQAALPELVGDLQQLLLDALNLINQIGEANQLTDRSYWDLPSISPHWQNQGFHDWVALIEMLRDAWLAIQKNNPTHAGNLAQDWFSKPYPTFKRLALFAATHDGCISSKDWVSWLLADDCWWLWSIDTLRETMRLLVLQGAHLTSDAQKRLETAILKGPPRKMYQDDIEPKHWQDIQDNSIWMYLAKLESGGCTLSMNAAEKLLDLATTNPDFRLATNESDEFSHWMSGTGDPDYHNERQVERAPRTRRELVLWLQKDIDSRFLYENDWREVCREKFPTAVCGLLALAKRNIWPSNRWREALQTWSEDQWIERSWRSVAPIVADMSDDALITLANSATCWLKAISKRLSYRESIFFALCRRYLELRYQGDVDDNQPVSSAINHPVGHITQALFNVWFLRKPNDNDGLPSDIKSFFTTLCESNKGHYRYGRVILASRLITLFRIDRSWTEQYLLPMFSWHNSRAEAKAAWEGFLWSPRIYQPLLAAFKDSFLDTANHYQELGHIGQQYAVILTYAALDPADTFTSAELSAATSALPQIGLQEAAQALVNVLEGAGEQREQYWTNRILPYWKTVWPKSRQLVSRPIAEKFARLAIAASGEFPAALETVFDWIQSLEHPSYVVSILYKANLCDRFPQDALRLLDAVVNEQTWPSRELGECLDALVKAWPEVLTDTRYQRIREYQRRR